MIFIRTIYILVLLTISTITLAQEISGTVKSSDGAPIEYANVVLLNSQKVFLCGVTSAGDGGFVFGNGAHGDDVVYVVTSYVGMRSDTLKIGTYTRMPLTIVLHEDSDIIGEIIVKGTRRLFKNERDMITANVQNTILARAGSLDKLLNQIPFVSGGDGSYNVFGRGSAIVYLNNRRVYDENVLKSLNSDQIKKVQVITNPGSRYPADVKSVIKIFTTDNPDGLGGNVYTNLITGRKVSNIDGASVVCNLGKWQFSGGLGYGNYNTREYTHDDASILTATPKEYTNDAQLDYDMKYIDGNLGMMYEFSPQHSLGLNARITQYRHKHYLNMESIDHFTNGVNDFHESGNNSSLNKPTQWLFNMFYTLTAGKTHIDITNDLMTGRQRRSMNYVEASNSSVATNNKSDYLMNSLVVDLGTQISSKISLNYGGELTFSKNEQTFSFSEKDINTEMSMNASKSSQWLGAAFASIGWTLGKLYVDAGLRYEYADWTYDEGGRKSKVYNNVFPTLNVSYNPNENTSLSMGFRQTIARPNYGQLNDNIEYQSRYYYIQGNSMLEPSITNSINLLASYKNLRFIGSLDFVDDDITMPRTVFDNTVDVIFSKATNMSHYMRWNAGVNWWHGFGIYTPYLELGIGGQDFSYMHLGNKRHYNRPFVNFKVHNTLNFKNNLSVNLFVDYYGKNYSLFSETTERWSSELSISKNIGKFFLQLSLNNMFCPRSRTSTTYCNWISDATHSDSDNRNVTLFVSYTFNYKQKKRNIGTKTSELNRF